MRFIELLDGQSVAIDKIESIEKVSEYTARVRTTSGRYYESGFPYFNLLQIIESEVEEKAPQEPQPLKYDQHVAL